MNWMLSFLLATFGVVFGGLIGYLVYLMIKSIEQRQIEVMLTQGEPQATPEHH
ncbi:putative Na+/H+ antiporter membrane protein [Pseudomonas fluorescens]|uniref:Putative Na+/H+ antiporter membrane protein n=1 Tax=Pseudomonas fluorescens TaxID=294 RepID=A0A379IKK5_PSEFL|nr:putative Na+/H+ antiporter membrane protein [Pseudomonas fluorescens]